MKRQKVPTVSKPETVHPDLVVREPVAPLLVAEMIRVGMDAKYLRALYNSSRDARATV
jgi:hypothetical protein